MFIHSKYFVDFITVLISDILYKSIFIKMKTMKIQFHPNIPPGSPGIAFDEERRAGEVAHSNGLARLGVVKTVGGTPMGASVKIS